MSKKMSNSNKIVLSYHDSLLRNSDIHLLEGPYWLNDTIIGFYFEYLNKMAGDSNSIKEVLYISPELTQLLKLTAFSDYEVLLESINAKSNSFVFFPLNNCDSRDSGGGTHWSLLLYSAPEKTCFHFDSSRGYNSAVGEAFSKNITDYFCGKDLGNYIEVNIPPQNNGYDCGLYVLCCADLLTNHTLSKAEIKNCLFESLELLVKEKRKKLLQLIDDLKTVKE